MSLFYEERAGGKTEQFINNNPAVILLAITLLPAALMGGGVYSVYSWMQQPVRHLDYWNVPEPQPIPVSMREASRCAAAIEEEDTNWESEMAALSALIESERPGQFDLAKEVITHAALRDYVEKLVRIGEAAVASFTRMRETAKKLDSLLADAPAKFRANAALARRWAEQEARADLKHDYLVLSDIWEAKALAAEKHVGDVREHLNSDLLEFFRSRQLFLERFLTMLNNGLAAQELREVATFRDTLKELIEKHEFLRSKLREWRGRLNGDLSSPAPQPEPQKSEATGAPRSVACEARSGEGSIRRSRLDLDRVTSRTTLGGGVGELLTTHREREIGAEPPAPYRAVPTMR